jgi:hypothetical protein
MDSCMELLMLLPEDFLVPILRLLRGKARRAARIACRVFRRLISSEISASVDMGPEDILGRRSLPASPLLHRLRVAIAKGHPLRAEMGQRLVQIMERGQAQWRNLQHIEVAALQHETSTAFLASLLGFSQLRTLVLRDSPLPVKASLLLPSLSHLTRLDLTASVPSTPAPHVCAAIGQLTNLQVGARDALRCLPRPLAPLQLEPGAGVALLSGSVPAAGGVQRRRRWR